jgi:PhnB protein
MRYKDAPPNPKFPVPENIKDYVLHAEMTISGTKVRFSDSQRSVAPGDTITLAVNFSTEAEVRNVYDKLREGGEVLMELAPQFFSPLYGWVKDKFGIGWQIILQ